MNDSIEDINKQITRIVKVTDKGDHSGKPKTLKDLIYDPDLDIHVRHLITTETKDNFEDINAEMRKLTETVGTCENRIDSELAKVAGNIPDTQEQTDLKKDVHKHQQELEKITNRLESLELTECEDVVIVERVVPEQNVDMKDSVVSAIKRIDRRQIAPR